MPRILPRLTRLAITGSYVSSPRPTPVRTPNKPVPALPSAIPADYSRSLLLSPGNVITNSHDYAHHKTAPHIDPVRARRRKGNNATHQVAPEMSAQERAWWSNPYIRMLGSPIRQCSLTGRYLPKDFLVRLARFKVPEPLHTRGKSPAFVIFPDGLQHHAFKARKSGRGIYLICAREWLDLFLRRGSYKRFGVAPPRLAEQISHILRLRVLQELLLITKRLQALYRERSGPAPALLRRLTRAELAQIRATGVIPHSGALAVIIVPPVNRDPTTKERPSVEGSMTDAPLEDPRPPTPKRATPPLSVLHPTSPPPREDLDVEPHAQEYVPLYNGVALFPGRVQRARLHELLTKILKVEGAWRFTAKTRSEHVQGSKIGENKASHAFLVCPSEEVDMAPLAVALWRVRMWEGQSQEVDHPPWVQENRRMQF